MKHFRLSRLFLCGLAALLTCSLLAFFTLHTSPTASAHQLQPHSGGGAIIYTHTATAANSAGDYTSLDHVGINGNPNLVIIATPNWNPPGHSGIYDNHPIGVFYSGGFWYIFNQDLTSIPTGASFNVYATASLDVGYEGAFVYTATTASIAGDYTVIDSASLNNHPTMRILVTPNWNPPGHSGVYDNSPIGVFYVTSLNKWAIFNQNLGSMPPGASFNINFASDIVGNTFIHTADASNSIGDYTTLNSVTDPNTLVFITANFNPNGGFGVYNNHNTGVFYTGNQWAIFNQDFTSIPNQAAFNVYTLQAQG